MDTDLHTLQNLLAQNAEFDGHLRDSGREDIAGEYHDMLDEVEVDRPSPDADTNAIINLYLPIHELVADINLLRDLTPENDEVRKTLNTIAHRYAINVQGAASIVFFAAIGMDNQGRGDALAAEYRGIKVGHSALHNDIMQLCKADALPNAVKWEDAQTQAFVSNRLLPRIHALDAQIQNRLETLEVSIASQSENESLNAVRINSGKPVAKPIAMTADEVRAAAAGANVVSLFGDRGLKK